MPLLTIDIPDAVAQTVAQLSDADRAAYLSRLGDFAEATLAEYTPSLLADDSDALPAAAADIDADIDADRHNAGKSSMRDLLAGPN